MGRHGRFLTRLNWSFRGGAKRRTRNPVIRSFKWQALGYGFRVRAGARAGMTAERIAKARRGDWQARGPRVKSAHDSSHRPRPRIGGIPRRRIGADAVRAAHHPSAVGRGDQRAVLHLVFLLLSPFLLHGETIEWRAVPIFAAVGLVFPAMLTMLTFASNRALGPVVDRRARQSVAAAFGRGRGAAAARAAASAAVRRTGGRRARRVRPSQSRAPRTCATGAPGRCCCRSARRCFAV